MHELPPAAEPARSPVATVAAAGRVVRIGSAPEGLAVDPRGDRAAVALRDADSATLAIVDPRSGRVLHRVALPGAPRHLGWDAARHAFIVPAETANRVLLVTPAGRVLSDTRVGAYPHDVAAAQGRVFAGDERGDAVSVLGHGVVTRPVAAQPGGLTITPDGRSLAVVSVRERVLELYDVRTLRRTARIAVGVGPTHVAGFGSHLYVTDTQGGALLVANAGQSIGGPFRSISLLAPRRSGGFPINKTARAARIDVAMTGDGWRLKVEGAKALAVSRAQLLAMDQHTHTLPIACVEGWSTTQRWTGVRISDLAALAGAPRARAVLVESLQPKGVLRQATLSADQLADDRALLALKVNGADLSLDHGYPARIIVPALPGVHCTKWVSAMTFET